MIFFTFAHDSPYSKKFVQVSTDNYEESRAVMLEAHGQKWAFQYGEHDFAGQIERYGLSLLCIIAKNEFGNWMAL